jgi:hypothetical protein
MSERGSSVNVKRISNEDPKAVYGYALSPRRISSDCRRSVSLSDRDLDRKLDPEAVFAAEQL